MVTESDSQTIAPLDENPVGVLDNPGEQMLCLLIRVASTPQGLKANPNPATVAMDDRVLWIGDPRLGPFKIGLETDDMLEVRVAENAEPDAPGYGFQAKGACKDGAAGDEADHVWRSGASHVVGGWPTRPSVILRYRLWEADGGTPGEIMTLFITNPRRQIFGSSGTVRPDDPI